jgi:hypothetical protein
MAGNKYDTPFEKVKPESYELTWTGLYGDKTTLIGTGRQVVAQIMKHLES